MYKCVGRQLSHEVLEQYRFRAIELRKKGWRVGKIAEAFGVNRRAVTRWFTLYNYQGKKALKSRKALGPKSKLTSNEKREIFSILKKSATDYNFETPLWTCRRLQQVIKKETGKHLDISNIWRWLIKWGLTNQKPERRASQSNEKEVKKWLKKEWPRIKAHARRWQAVLYFQDEACVSLTAVLGKTWAPKGKTPVVKVTGKRGSFCISSAISPAGRMVFRIEKESVKAKVFIGFLKQIIRHHPYRKVIVVTDKASPHTAKAVHKFVEENKKRFVLYYLPSYSPQLNPDEHVWGYLKNHKLKTHQAQTKAEFKPLIISKMRSIQKSPQVIQSFFRNSYEL